MDHDTRGFLLALTAMNVRVISEIAAAAPDSEKAREVLAKFEAGILTDINKMAISLKPGETSADLDRLRATARGLVADWLASIRFK